MYTQKTDVCIKGVTLHVEYTYFPPCRGAYRDGLKIEPDEPEDIEIDKVTADPGEDLSPLFDIPDVNGWIRDSILGA